MTLHIGDTAPDFTVDTQLGKIGLGSFAGGGGELPLAWPSVFTGEVDVLPSERGDVR